MYGGNSRTRLEAILAIHTLDSSSTPDLVLVFLLPADSEDENHNIYVKNKKSYLKSKSFCR